MLSSGLSKHLRVMPSSFFGVALFIVEGSRDFWHWFSGPFPYSISPSSSPYLHKPWFSENDKNSKNTFQGDSFANKSDSCSTYTFWGGLAPINIDRSSNCWRYMIQVSLSGAASDAVVIHVIFYARSSIWSTWSSIWSLLNTSGGFIMWLSCQRLDLSIHSNFINLCDCKMPAGRIRCMTL